MCVAVADVTLRIVQGKFLPPIPYKTMMSMYNRFVLKMAVTSVI